MLTDLAGNQDLYDLLYRIDQDLANEIGEKGCGHCGGPLHQANYERKPRGGPNLDNKFVVRRSWCCGAEGCRRRTKPPSVLFLNQRVYWGCVILIVTTLQQGRDTGHSIGKLVAQFGMSRSTLKRWLGYFQEIFPSSSTWKKLRGRVSSKVGNHLLPKDLLDSYRIAETGVGGMANCLLFLARGFNHEI